MDPATIEITRLFHPRQDCWHEHFEWAGATLVGRTAVGRVTVVVLRIDDPVRSSVRQALILEGGFPPPSRGG